MEVEGPHCLTAVHPDALTGGGRPWAPGNREEDVDIERAATHPDDRVWCMSEVDIFRDLDDREMDAMAAAAPMKSYGPGDLIYTPHQPLETLFILKKGRIRIFRVSPDGRALTTAIIDRARSSARWSSSASRCTTASPRPSTTSLCAS